MEEAKEEKKQRKRSGKSHRPKHHPWDEVSLPGAGTSPTEQQTILQLLNNKQIQQRPQEAAEVDETPAIDTNTSEASETIKVDSNEAINFTAERVGTPLVLLGTSTNEPAAESKAVETNDDLVSSHSSATKTKNSYSNLVSKERETETETATKAAKLEESAISVAAPSSTLERQRSRRSSTEHSDILDIESHLIETYDEYQAPKDSVGINELPPQRDELTEGSSKVETNVNVRTVIEVEPAGAVSKKPIEFVVQAHQAQCIETGPEDGAIIQAEPATESTTQAKEAGYTAVPNDAIKASAEKLVNEIEREVLEILRQGNETQKELHIDTLVASQASINEDVTNPIGVVEKTEQSTTLLDEISDSLSQRVDVQLSEITSIFRLSKPSHVVPQLSSANGEALSVDATQTEHNELKIVNVPSLKTAFDERERKLFLDSLPQIETNKDAQKLADDCKREYYQSLKKYLIQSSSDRPPVPLQTYRWEDLRRAKERGGYPWTHLYKRPLGPDEEPEIVLLLRKSQEFRFASESPKSLKKVRIDEQVIVKEAERYIQELTTGTEPYSQSAPKDEETHSLRSESTSCVSDSILATGKPRKSTRLEKIRGYLRRRKGGRSHEDAQSLPCTSTSSSRRHSQDILASANQPQILLSGPNPERKHCYPIMKKLKIMADRQKKRLNIRRIHLGKDDHIVLGEETKILKLKKSPKAERGEIPHFIEKQDSDDVLEIMELDESPSRKWKDDGREADNSSMPLSENPSTPINIVVPDEIIDLPKQSEQMNEGLATSIAPASISGAECNTGNGTPTAVASTDTPPRKAPRLRREHVYEEIEQDLPAPSLVPTENLADGILELAAVEALKESLAQQDNSTLKHIEDGTKSLPLDRMGSSEDEQICAAANAGTTIGDKAAINLLAPISSIDSISSDENQNRAQLSTVAEESDAGGVEETVECREAIELKSAIKKEASPAPSDKKVTFSHVEDEAEPHREDIELPAEIQEAAQLKKWADMSDHEYEPISAPPPDETPSQVEERSPSPLQSQSINAELALNIERLHEEIKDVEEFQRDLEERYFSSEATTPRTESRTDYEIHTSQVDSSALEELPLKPENRKKGFMASAQDRTRKMQAGLKTQAGKIKTKLRPPIKKPASSSPKAKERKRFKTPEFSKIKMPEIKRPDMSKLKDFKRPDFTKFNKPDMSKFKLPEKFPTLKLKRSKSFKENGDQDVEVSNATHESDAAPTIQPHKKMFDFNFGTYPRAFRKNKKPLESQISLGTETGTEGVSVIPSTETQPSLESSSTPQGDRGPGPVRSRWADKFSDVSYNDSEGSRYRRYGSEQESFDRESSLERRMKDDLAETESEAQDLGILGGVADTKQFAEFDEENRAIHEISKMRAGEFRRRPIVHQDSDLRSEDSKEVEGWTEKEIEKNKLLRKAELEAELSYLKYSLDEGLPQENHSIASSEKKVVMEEIDDDEFFLRKRGVSEDNIELRQYISNAIREGYDKPLNALEHVGQTSEQAEYGDYDIPPPKPKRLQKSYQPQNVSQDLESQRSGYGDDLSMSQNGSDFFTAPKRPLRKGRSRSKYSMDSQDFPVAEENIRHEQYFDDDEEYLRPPRNNYKDTAEKEMNDLNLSAKQTYALESEAVNEGVTPPQAPRRRKRESSMDKDSYMNGFGGRSVSNSYLQPNEDVIVYRTEHEYPISLATPEHYTPSVESRISGSAIRYDGDDHTPGGVESLGIDVDGESQRQGTEQKGGEAKFIIDMIETDGYAIVRKEQVPKPTPPARRKKFTRSPGERFATMPSGPVRRGTPPPERPPPPREYTPSAMEEAVAPRPNTTARLDMAPEILEDDYEEPEAMQQERPESPRDLHSGDVINKMKFRPLPPPPRPPRERRQRSEHKGSRHSAFISLHQQEFTDEKIATSSTADSYDPTDVDLDEEEARLPEVEAATQTDPLPDDFECEEFEITDDMKIIEPRINSMRRTLDELLREEEQKIATMEEPTQQLTEEEQLARGLQRFRDANQRSMSERSRASSQADRSKSQSRPQTPSAVVIERRVATPIPSQQSETMLQASLIVRPIDDLELEEEALRREGLLTDSSQQSKSDVEAASHDEDESKLAVSDYSHGPSSEELNAALDELRTQDGSNYDEEKDETEMREYVSNAQITPKYLGYMEAETSGKEDEETHRFQFDSEVPLTTSEDEYVTKDNEQVVQIIKDGVRQEETTEEVAAQMESESEVLTHDCTTSVEREKLDEDILCEEPPMPPPRRKSATTIEASPMLTVMEQPSKELTPVQSLVAAPSSLTEFPAHLGDLEVDRLRVHALQASQIMVSQLHGTQISSDELECKSGKLVVQNITLPDGFIEDIVERVRSTDRNQLLTAETQTSLQTSTEALSAEKDSPVREAIPPPKPPRQRDLESVKRTPDVNIENALQQLRNYDEETQTDPVTYPATTTIPPPVYTTTEYLHSMSPMALYNLHRADEQQYGGIGDGMVATSHRRHHHHHHHHHRRCDTSCTESEDESTEQGRLRSRSHSRRSRSSTRPPAEPQSVAKAAKQLLSACSLSIVQTMNQLTATIRGADPDKNVETQLHQIPALVALLVVISFTLIVYMFSGRNVHTHHWDFFNPPGNGARPT